MVHGQRGGELTVGQALDLFKVDFGLKFSILIVVSKEDIWDITSREQTKIKLDILKKYLKPWADIIGEHFPEAYYVDCFAGRGKYHKDGLKDCVSGSPLIALDVALNVQQRKKQKKGKNFKMKVIAIESNRVNHAALSAFVGESNSNNEVEVTIHHGNFTDLIGPIVKTTDSSPAFFFIDPTGIKVPKEALDVIIDKNGPTEIFLNYMTMGVRRVAGLQKVTSHQNERIKTRAITSLSNLDDLFGDKSWIDKKEDRDLLRHFTDRVLKRKYRFVLNFDMPYPDRSETFYNLLFATNHDIAQKIMKHIFTKKLFEGTLFESKPFEVDWNI